MFKIFINLIFRKNRIKYNGIGYSKLELLCASGKIIVFIPDGCKFAYGSKCNTPYPKMVRLIKESDLTIISE